MGLRFTPYRLWRCDRCSVRGTDRIFGRDPTAAKPRGLPGRNGDDYYLLDPGEILAFCAERELVWIITARQKYLAGQSLRTIQDRVDERQFRRVHRNALVNLDHVRRMCPLSSQRWRITVE